uniref:RING-type domain-containing protein n=1 Tax=Panagrellus redivivus TaxID=6233 RepID=A0A7E4W0J1_PANRE
MDSVEPTVVVVDCAGELSAPNTGTSNLKLSPSPNRRSPSQRPPDFVNPLEKIEQLLTCAICLDRYKQPKLLPCHHSFCLPCLESYADSVHRNLKCPECRAEHAIPYDGVKSFQTNYTLTGFLDIHLEATDDNAEQLEAYISRYNLERCKICDEKAELEICRHCDRKACKECRTSHMEMVKRDLGRMLNQVRRLSNRVKEAAESLSKGVDLLHLNVETTKTEIKEYFIRYHADLKRREESLNQELETFQQTESRLMRSLRDVLTVESDNLTDAVTWVDAIISGEQEAKDDELYRLKTVFSDGLEYLRGFAPDFEEFFAKKIKFSPGDDASKLPMAITNFGELTVALPQFPGRYIALEQQYLPKPLRMGFESDSYRTSRRTEIEERSNRHGSRLDDDISMNRYRRRTQLDDDSSRNRLRVGTESGRNSPSTTPFSPGNNPWSRPINDDSAIGTSASSTQDEGTRASPGSTTDIRLRRRDSSRIRQRHRTAIDLTSTSALEGLNSLTNFSRDKPSTETSSANASRKPPLPKQASSTDDPILNDKVESIRLAHEQRQKNRHSLCVVSSSGDEEEPTRSIMPSATSDNVRKIGTQKFRVHCRSGTPKKLTLSAAAINTSEDGNAQTNDSVQLSSTPPAVLPIPISYFPDNSLTHRYCAPPTPKQESFDTAPTTPTTTTAAEPLPTPATETGNFTRVGSDQRRNRFRRRSSIVPDREFSLEGQSGTGRLSRSNSFMSTPLIDYGSKHKPKLMIGRRGENPGEMNWPRGVAALPGGEFAVCDSSNHRIQLFDSTGKLIRTFGKYGTEEGELDSCAAVAYNRYKQQIIVSDRYNHRIQIFEIDGKFTRQFGSFGSGNGQFNNPWGLAVDELGVIYVADKDNHRIQVFDQNGNFMMKFGTHGSDIGQFNHPLFIAIHRRTQNIFISDSANHRICVFDHDSTPILCFGIEGFHTGQLKLPRGIALDDQGFVIVADSGNNRVQIFSPDGKFVHGFGNWGTGPGQLKGIEGVALVDTSIVVSDRENHRVQIF